MNSIGGSRLLGLSFNPGGAWSDPGGISRSRPHLHGGGGGNVLEYGWEFDGIRAGAGGGDVRVYHDLLNDLLDSFFLADREFEGRDREFALYVVSAASRYLHGLVQWLVAQLRTHRDPHSIKARLMARCRSWRNSFFLCRGRRVARHLPGRSMSESFPPTFALCYPILLPSQ